MEKREVYLDNAATTRVDDRVIEQMVKYMRTLYANPHASHNAGHQAEMAIDVVRKMVSKAIRSRPEEIFFTSGGTEADNTAIIGTFHARKSLGKRIIISKIEHSAITNACRHLELNYDAEIIELSVNEFGMIDTNELANNINKNTILVSIMTANNEIGTIQPIKEIGKICKEFSSNGYPVLFHTDSVQAFGKVDIDVKRDGIDMLSISAHKFHGPKGIGALYLRNEGKTFDDKYIEPITYGGNQENGMRSGTANVPGIVGLGKAIELIMTEKDEIARLKHLQKKLFSFITSELGNGRVTGHPTERLSNNASFCIPDLSGEKILNLLSSNSIYCSTGSACSAKSKSVSHVLKACKIPEPDIFGCLRWSLGRFNTEEEIDYALEILKKIVYSLRSKK